MNLISVSHNLMYSNIDET